jgi:DNA-binding NarL/FixJ family response regulator
MANARLLLMNTEFLGHKRGHVMDKNRLLLLNNQSVLAAGMLALLRAVEDLEVTEVAADDPTAAEQSGRFKLDVILLDGKHNPSFIAQLLERNPAFRIIPLNVDQTEIGIYRLDRLAVDSFDDFLDAISTGATGA